MIRKGHYAKGNYHSDHEIQIASGNFVRCTCGWSFNESTLDDAYRAFQQHKDRLTPKDPE